MTTARPRRLGNRPGPKPRLSREAIIDAAIRAGIEHVTMQSVATALGSSAAGLYRYFDSRDELVVAALQHLLTSLPLPAAADGWRAFLQAEADSRWELLTRYAGLLHDNAASLESIATDVNKRVAANTEAETRAALIAIFDGVRAMNEKIQIVGKELGEDNSM